ncbi:hypothetical protein [Stygiolobus azoricus]|uniref:hypothetical protein n=1 Tax=Stygiolobus azoricus TaxID=41675 RepID=UPI001E4100C8|nr:hypothetical protein [Stygiolobus azoricus]
MTYFSQVVESDLPAVISVVGEINTPRIPSVKQILESQKKPIRTLQCNSSSKIKIVSLTQGRG